MCIRDSVNAIGDFSNSKINSNLHLSAIDNLKRIINSGDIQLESEEMESPYIIKSFMEAKTTRHPLELGFTSSNSY